MDSLVFCKISCMKYYKGAGHLDKPYNGGSFVYENGFGHEEYNFLEREIPNDWVDDSGKITAGTYCFGFVETKSTTSTKSNQLHIEKIFGVGDSFKRDMSVSGITVVWCATTDLNEVSVVGWYKNAVIYRRYQSFQDAQGNDRSYNILAHSSDCLLLPQGTRHRHIWRIPSKKYTRSFGFGQSLLWYAQEESALPYLQRLLDNINGYTGENWLYNYPE